MANTMHATVTIGGLEIFMPEDLTDFELERAVGESDEEFQQAREMYDLLFSRAWLLLNRPGR